MVDLQSVDWAFGRPFNKAGAYRFTDSTVQVLNTRKNDGSILYEMELYDGEQSTVRTEQGGTRHERMDRLHRQAQRYKEALSPPERGSWLLGMRKPIRTPWRAAREERSESWTTSALCTVISTMAGASGVVPGEDSFRKLTDEELAEETVCGQWTRTESGPRYGNVRRLWGERLEIESRPSLPNRFCSMPLKRSFPWEDIVENRSQKLFGKEPGQCLTAKRKGSPVRIETPTLHAEVSQYLRDHSYDYGRVRQSGTG